MRRAAIIDLGSNAGRMAVFAYDPGRRIQQIDQLKQTLRLASGADNIIRGEAFEEGIRMLSGFRTYCDANEIDEVIAVATSAVRDAANGAGFVSAAKERANIELQILTGPEEARWGVLGVANSHAAPDALVLDVGGGSAQLSVMESRSFVEGQSWPIGGVRMRAAFLGQDPVRGKDIEALAAHVKKTVDGRLGGLGGRGPLIGMGGTIRNLAKIQQAKTSYPISLVHGYSLERSTVSGLVEHLAGMTLEARRRVSGLNRDRADVIVAGAVVLRTLMELCEAERVVVSGHGLREGLAGRCMWSAEQGHLSPDVRAFTIENIARRYYDRPAHNQHVRKLALQLFDGLAEWHGFGEAEREVLGAAALLHDIGMAVEYFDHHLHGRFLVTASALPGYSHREQALIALLVGAHRKGRTRIGPLAAVLEPGDDARVAKLGGMLRLAEYLERTKAQRVDAVRCHLGAGYLQVEVIARADVTVEIQAARQRSDLLAKAFGVEVEVVLGGTLPPR